MFLLPLDLVIQPPRHTQSYAQSTTAAQAHDHASQRPCTNRNRPQGLLDTTPHRWIHAPNQSQDGETACLTQKCKDHAKAILSNSVSPSTDSTSYRSSSVPPHKHRMLPKHNLPPSQSTVQNSWPSRQRISCHQQIQSKHETQTCLHALLSTWKNRHIPTSTSPRTKMYHPLAMAHTTPDQTRQANLY